jgi:hypothetical protein
MSIWRRIKKAETDLDGKVTANQAITASLAPKTKLGYDIKGLVTTGALAIGQSRMFILVNTGSNAWTIY